MIGAKRAHTVSGDQAAPIVAAGYFAAGVGFNIAFQVAGNYDEGRDLWDIDWRSVAFAGVEGIAFGGLGRGAQALGRNVPYFCRYLGTPLAKTALAAGSGSSIYYGATNIYEGNWATGTLQIGLGLIGLGALGRASICFPMGYQIVRSIAPEPLVASVDATAPEQAANWSFSYLALAGATLAAGLWGIGGGKQQRAGGRGGGAAALVHPPGGGETRATVPSAGRRRPVARDSGGCRFR